MARGLTKKEKKYVDEFVEHGIGTKAALVAYDTEDYMTAANISSENLKKPKIIGELVRRMSDEMVEGAHASLLTAVKLDYFVFAKAMSDEEIQSHVESVGLNLINIRPSEKGKLAFFSLPEGSSRAKGVELYHKYIKNRGEGNDTPPIDPRLLALGQWIRERL